jgi:hypothetical protein
VYCVIAAQQAIRLRRFQVSGATSPNPDRQFIEECVRAYYKRCPEDLRRGFLRPIVHPPVSVSQPADRSWPLTVPPEMCERVIGSGEAIWQPTFATPSRFNAYEPSRGPDSTVLDLFLRHVRLCHPLIRSTTVSFILPDAAAHDPAFGMSKLYSRWRLLLEDIELSPVAMTEDGTGLLCIDLSEPTPDKDHPVVLIQLRDAFYLTAGANVPRQRLFDSFRDLLTTCLLNNHYDWSADPPPQPRTPAAGNSLPPFDWGKWLTGRGADAAPDEAGLREHCERLTVKLATLRQADPACLIWYTESHRYRLNPTISEDAVAEFEAAEGCRLPEAYRYFITHAGNGGFGAGNGIPRLEHSSGDYFTTRSASRGSAKGHLHKPFPHKQAWAVAPPLPEGEDDPAVFEYHSVSQIAGSVLLEVGLGIWETFRSPLLLIVNGPERGNIWWDGRSATRTGLAMGIHPVVQLGAYSLFIWLEEAIDFLLARIDELYARLPNVTRVECIRLSNQAFKLDRVLRTP